MSGLRIAGFGLTLRAFLHSTRAWGCDLGTVPELRNALPEHAKTRKSLMPVDAILRFDLALSQGLY